MAAQLEEERAAHKQALEDLGAELAAAQELSRSSADSNATADALSAEVARLQQALGRAHSRLQATEDRAQVARATATAAELARDAAQRDVADTRAELARLAAERRQEVDAGREREEALLREVERLRGGGPAAFAGGSSWDWQADLAGVDLPEHVVRILSANEAEVVAAVQETELMAEALTALQDALDEATGQLQAHKQLTADAQCALGEAAAALEAAAQRERDLMGTITAEKDSARDVIARLRTECESLLLGTPGGDVDDGVSEWMDAGRDSRMSMRSGVTASSRNPYDADLRKAVHAQNRARFEKVKAERDALRATVAERDVQLRRLQEQLAHAS